MRDTVMLLAGDIGGTKTNLAVYSPEAGLRAPLVEGTFPSTNYGSLEALVSDFLLQTGMRVERASFGVAGPVVAGQAKITNLPWVMDEVQLREALGLSSVRLLNDLSAIGHAIPWLEPADVHTLNEGQARPGGAIAIVAPGTGLGEAFLTWDGARYQSHASEGGHADWAPSGQLQLGLLRYLMERFGHVSVERVCSGRGIPNIYAYLKDSGHAEEPNWLAEELAQASDPTPVIAKAALNSDRSCALCVSTLDVFVRILGAEAGNLALGVMATGGVYLGGGIPPRILPLLEDGRFLDAFRQKGRFSDMLSRIPIRVILNPKAALLGAACYGLGLR
jgi:glucokinase